MSKAPNATQRKLAKMLKENTGSHFLDSGGAYGRNWQRNQTRDFMSESATVLAPVDDYVEDGAEFSPEVTHNVFHFLSEALDYDASMDRRYQAFARRRRQDDAEMEIMESFMDYLRERGHELGGLYGEGKPFTVNTYNGEDLLSQTLQYLYFACDGEEYVLLQIHGGADVRGGYTNAVAFKAGEGTSGVSIYDNAWASIWPTEPEAENGELFGQRRGLWERPYWTTDDGWNWYFQGSTAGRGLRDFTISRDPTKRGDGEHVWIDENGAPHCPMTGLKLEAVF